MVPQHHQQRVTSAHRLLRHAHHNLQPHRPLVFASQVLSVLGVVVAALTAQVMCKPYVYERFNKLERASLVATSLILYLCCFFLVTNLSDTAREVRLVVGREALAGESVRDRGSALHHLTPPAGVPSAWPGANRGRHPQATSTHLEEAP